MSLAHLLLLREPSLSLSLLCSTGVVVGTPSLAPKESVGAAVLVLAVRALRLARAVPLLAEVSQMHIYDSQALLRQAYKPVRATYTTVRAGPRHI